MQRMTYARKKAATPATAAKPNDAWMPDAAPVKVLPLGLTGLPVAAGLVAFYCHVSTGSCKAWVGIIIYLCWGNGASSAWGRLGNRWDSWGNGNRAVDDGWDAGLDGDGGEHWHSWGSWGCGYTGSDSR